MVVDNVDDVDVDDDVGGLDDDVDIDDVDGGLDDDVDVDDVVDFDEDFDFDDVDDVVEGLDDVDEDNCCNTKNGCLYKSATDKNNGFGN